ncbi:hypothetical protein PENTCL1PPCAC_15747, partial [Pristionchus entomophagus]
SYPLQDESVLERIRGNHGTPSVVRLRGELQLRGITLFSTETNNYSLFSSTFQFANEGMRILICYQNRTR